MANAADVTAWQTHVPWNHDGANVMKTGSGLEYIVLDRGPAGGETPGLRSEVTIHYEGHLNADNSKFDSSFDRGETASFPVAGVVEGFSEALQLMRPGDSWLVFIPSSLGYGARGSRGAVPPNADLVFEIEMKSFTTPPDIDRGAWSKFTPWNSSAPEVQKTASGLEYVVLASGPAEGAAARKDQEVEIYYEGRLASGGEAFDSAFERGQTEVFPVAAVVPGFSEALQLMKPGDRWLVRIPSDLGYGARGAGGVIPPNADLIFEILVVEAY
ncbi:MAG: FKBP-type peptidyl-prolyl cis-trans isomerase [Hyphomonadaceae bacterium]